MRFWPSWMRPFRGRSEAQEVRAGELAAWLTSAGLPRNMVLPKASLIELLS